MQFMQPITGHAHFINGVSGCQISQDQLSLIKSSIIYTDPDNCHLSPITCQRNRDLAHRCRSLRFRLIAQGARVYKVSETDRGTCGQVEPSLYNNFVNWFPGVEQEQIKQVLDHAAKSAQASA